MAPPKDRRSAPNLTLHIKGAALIQKLQQLPDHSHSPQPPLPESRGGPQFLPRQANEAERSSGYFSDTACSTGSHSHTDISRRPIRGAPSQQRPPSSKPHLDHLHRNSLPHERSRHPGDYARVHPGKVSPDGSISRHQLERPRADQPRQHGLQSRSGYPGDSPRVSALSPNLGAAGGSSFRKSQGLVVVKAKLGSPQQSFQAHRGGYDSSPGESNIATQRQRQSGTGRSSTKLPPQIQKQLLSSPLSPGTPRRGTAPSPVQHGPRALPQSLQHPPPVVPNDLSEHHLVASLTKNLNQSWSTKAAISDAPPATSPGEFSEEESEDELRPAFGRQPTLRDAPELDKVWNARQFADEETQYSGLEEEVLDAGVHHESSGVADLDDRLVKGSSRHKKGFLQKLYSFELGGASHQESYDREWQKVFNQGATTRIIHKPLVGEEDPTSVLGYLTEDVRIYYSIRKELGRGHMGVVRACIDRETNEILACKTIDKERLQTAAEIRDLQQEIAVMEALTGHPHIVELKGVYEDARFLHLVMELCRGGELLHELLTRSVYKEAEAGPLFHEIVLAVGFCHYKGVMHGDLKPENICLATKLLHASDPHPTLKLADFGLSLFMKQKQKVKGSAGSPYYMAPEVIGGKYGMEADIWALGVILYVLLGGMPPFWGANEDEVFRAVKLAKPEFKEAAWRSVSDDAKALVLRMLSKDPKKRPSALALLKDSWVASFAKDPGPSSQPVDAARFVRAARVQRLPPRFARSRSRGHARDWEEETSHDRVRSKSPGHRLSKQTGQNRSEYCSEADIPGFFEEKTLTPMGVVLSPGRALHSSGIGSRNSRKSCRSVSPSSSDCSFSGSGEKPKETANSGTLLEDGWHKAEEEESDLDANDPNNYEIKFNLTRPAEKVPHSWRGHSGRGGSDS